MAIDLSGLDPWSSVGGDMSGVTTTGSGAASSGSSLSKIGSAIGSFAGPIGSIAGGLLGGLFGGGDDGGAAKKAYVRQVNLLKYNQEYEAKMSNTAIQRRVADLSAAGINPMLAVMGGGGLGGASTPSPSAPSVQKSVSGVDKASSAMAAAAMGRASALDAAAIAKTLSETRLVDAQTAEVQARTPTYASSIDLNSAQIERIAHENNLTDSQTNQLIATWEETFAHANLMQAEKIKILLHDIPNIDSQTAKNLVEKLDIQAGIPFTKSKSSLASGFTDLIHLPEASKFINSGAAALGEEAAREHSFIRRSIQNDSSRRTSKGFQP